MDRIEAWMGLSPHMGQMEHLSLYVNGRRLDEILSAIDSSYLGLIPAWLDYYDKNFVPSAKEKEYVWRQTKPAANSVELPILLCPDDFDFSCTVIVVEVIWREDVVIWNRFGADVTPFDQEEAEWPRYIGKKVRWLSGVGPFTFPKSEYLLCISQFEKAE